MNKKDKNIKPLSDMIFTSHLERGNKTSMVIIYPPTIDWNYMRQRPQQIMEQFSMNGFEVFYCNKTQSKHEQYTSINPNLRIVHNNADFIANVIPLLKKQKKKIILWVSWSKLHSILDFYNPDFIIYDYLDDFEAWEPFMKPMVDKADIVITTSGRLMNRIVSDFPHKPSFMVPNGCDLSHFRRKDITVPEEFSMNKGPIITYSGAWASWINRELVEKIALTHTDSLVAIIGTEFGVSVPKHIPNLKYIGYKSYDELPNYLQNSSLCIIPFIINPITVATNPIKMYEYLAAGRPVVSTDIPEARNIPGVYIGKDDEGFLENIRLILNKSIVFNEKEVYPWLEAHTWEKRFAEIHRIINKFISAA